MKILVTGACGYIGSVLVPDLLSEGHRVFAWDTMWFGNHLTPHPHLEVSKQDIRHVTEIPDVDVVLHLASIANDPCGDLDPRLTWETNVLATMRLADLAERCDTMHKFLFASSGSVYGVKSEDRVTEDLSLVPISEYNKSKMVAERVLRSYQENFEVCIVRPATVCGLSPRMRLDVAVNMLTMQALTKGRILVLGGDQIRPNIHIRDMSRLYRFLLSNGIGSGTFNAGFLNLSIRQIAETIGRIVDADIAVLPSNDPRSYRLDSSRILAKGFQPQSDVKDAIREIVAAYRAGTLKDEDVCYNLRWMSSASYTPGFPPTAR